MATISAFNIKNLSHDEAYGFLNEVAHQLKEACETFPDAAVTFIDALKQFDDSLKGDDAILSSTELYEADAIADRAWMGLNLYLKAMIRCPDENKRTAAKIIWDVFSKYENPTDKPFGIEYGIMERILDDLNTIPIEVRKTADAQIWIEYLSECTKNFTDMYTMRIQEKAHKVTGIVQSCKLKAINAYREMIKVINALLVISPTDELETFSVHVNQLIDNKKAILKARKTRVASAKLEETKASPDGE